jgi:serine/threonine-protein kinase RsbW
LITLVSELELTSAMTDLAQAYPWLDEAAAGVEATNLPRIHVALEEAVANAALHGFPDGRVGHIKLRAEWLTDSLVLQVSDDGVAFDPTAVATRKPASSLDDVEPGGWGLGLIRAFATSVAYERRDDHNCLTMRFRLKAENSA